jgi:hypothetical protein
MKAEIRDPALLHSLRPVDLAAYLAARGWSKVAEIGTVGGVWEASRADAQAQVMLPADHTVGDFDLRMGELLASLAAWERRSQFEVFTDLQQFGTDVIRVRASVDGADGTIPLADGARLVDQAREMLLAAASATVRRAPFFQRRKPAEAIAYLEEVRMGQTEIGSYVATFLSPITPALLPQEGLGFAEPFERKVVQTLCEAVGAARDAAIGARNTREYAAFAATVPLGVSANLCEALAGLSEAVHGPEPLEIAVTWSPMRPVPDGPTWHVQLAAELAPVLREAARTLKEQVPPADVEVVGPVVKLARPEGQPQGTIWLVGLVGNSLKTMMIELGHDDYEIALEAHRQETHIRVRGTIVRTGRTYELQDPQDFSVFDEPDLDSLLDDETQVPGENPE